MNTATIMLAHETAETATTMFVHLTVLYKKLVTEPAIKRVMFKNVYSTVLILLLIDVLRLVLRDDQTTVFVMRNVSMRLVIETDLTVPMSNV